MAYGPNANEKTWFHERLCLELVIVMVIVIGNRHFFLFTIIVNW